MAATASLEPGARADAGSGEDKIMEAHHGGFALAKRASLPHVCGVSGRLKSTVDIGRVGFR